MGIIVFLLVLGLLIFFHEMGHFLAAKACGVFVDRFSLGMPPRIVGFKWGDTDYCIGALPIGGYVKMAGQEDSPRSEEEQMADYAHVPKEKWFSEKPIWQRYVIIVAGPAMNLVLAFFLYVIAAAVGGEVPMHKVDNRVGEIEATMPAATARMWAYGEDGASPDTSTEPDAYGWQTGDRVLSIDGQQVRAIMPDLVIEAMLGNSGQRSVEIERTEDDGTIQRYVSLVTPVEDETDPDAPPQFGVGSYNAALVGNILSGEPAANAGLKPGDTIVAVDGEPTERDSLTKYIQEHMGEEIDIVVERDGEKLDLALTPRRNGRLLDVIVLPPLNIYSYIDESNPPAISEESTIAKSKGLAPGTEITSIGGEPANWATVKSWLGAEGSVSLALSDGTELELSAAEALNLATGYDTDAPVTVGLSTDESIGLKRNDKIVAVNGQPATVGMLATLQDELAGQTMELKIERAPVLLGLLRGGEEFEVEVPVQEVGAIGVVWGEEKVFHRFPAAEVAPEALARAKQDANRVISTLYKLGTGQVSAKNLGGPVMIYQATTSQWQQGMIWLLHITAFISVNLAIFNLLPLPVLDGGQCVLLALEAIRRKPLEMAIVERIQMAGVLLLIGLMLFVTMNDIQRLITGYLS